MVKKIEKTEAEWREILSPQEFDICRNKGTEAAFTGEYWDCKLKGAYHCRACDESLFDAESKYDSGSGWPSFWQANSEDRVEICTDGSHGMVREEVICASCGSHLGHRFNDGPNPTGQRFCINSASIKLNSDEK